MKNNERQKAYIVIAFDTATVSEAEKNCECWTTQMVMAASEASAFAEARKLLEDGVIPLCAFTAADLAQFSEELQGMERAT